jgi:hypothetical protein
LKHCELCGLDNPEEARFCMKCGSDLDAVSAPDVPVDVFEASTFTPAGEVDRHGGGRSKSAPPQPTEDKETYKEAAASESPGIFVGAGDEGEPPEIQQTGVTADFAGKKSYCERCGRSNPRDQKYCLGCGFPIGDEPPSADESAESAPLDDVVMETTTLADISPFPDGPDLMAEPDPRPYSRRENIRWPRMGGVFDWSAREWSLLIAAAAIAVLLIWFFLFGGISMFSGTSRDVKKAGSTMESLDSFAYEVDVSLEATDSVYGGGGRAIQENPESAAWQLILNMPGRENAPMQHVQVLETVYVDSGTGWQTAQPGTDVKVSGFWKDFSSPEQVSSSNSGELSYEYHVPPEILLEVLGVGEQQGASDASVNISIDENSFNIVRISATVYNIRIGDERIKATLDMALSETGQEYGISKPI